MGLTVTYREPPSPSTTASTGFNPMFFPSSTIGGRDWLLYPIDAPPLKYSLSSAKFPSCQVFCPVTKLVLINSQNFIIQRGNRNKRD
ncbi:hypothetical protein QCA50_009881 [Cerrena zonata]|uniref:Uncharacterized protein n=1 Tax=Cerrena zonata TaxID=2478898 RepID=A0AAW0GA43_9APHY